MEYLPGKHAPNADSNADFAKADYHEQLIVEVPTEQRSATHENIPKKLAKSSWCGPIAVEPRNGLVDSLNLCRHRRAKRR